MKESKKCLGCDSLITALIVRDIDARQAFRRIQFLERKYGIPRSILRITLDELESTAMLGAKAIRNFLQSDDPDDKQFQKAKIGGVAISGFAKLRQSETGRMAVELSMEGNLSRAATVRRLGK